MSFRVTDDYRGDLLFFYNLDLVNYPKSIFLLRLSESSKVEIQNNNFEDNVALVAPTVNVIFNITTLESKTPVVLLQNNTFTRNYAMVGSNSFMFVTETPTFASRWACGMAL
jgi:hypothetical protein